MLASATILGIMSFSSAKETEEIEIETIDTPEPSNNPMDPELRNVYLVNKSINADYVGELKFKSGIINQSVVCAHSLYDASGELYTFYTEDGVQVTDPEGYTGNDVYIWTYWKTMTYDYNINGGSVFADYRSFLDDQNYIIYGHHFSVIGGNDPERIKAFTPLELILEEENYEKAQYVDFVLDNEIRHYELAVVYEYDINDDFYNENCQYYRTNYDEKYTGEDDPGYYDTYIASIKKVQLYDTGVELKNTDRTLTLQTCITNHVGELYEILVYKEIGDEFYWD